MDYYEHERSERGDGLWADGRVAVKAVKAVKASKPYCDRLPPKSRWLWGDFSDYLTNRRLSSHIAKANQWYPSDKAGDDLSRIVMPATSDQPGNHFWQARYMGGDPRVRRYESPHGVSSGDATIIVYPHIYTYTESIVVEGPMCALAAAGTGRLGIATMGADPPEERLELIFRRVHGTICNVIPDTDRRDALIKIFGYLANRGVTCRLLDPGPSKDFADMSPEARTQLLR